MTPDLADRIAARLCECWDVGERGWDGFLPTEPENVARLIREMLEDDDQGTTPARARATTGSRSPKAA